MGGDLRAPAIITVVALFDWLTRGRRRVTSAAAVTWDVSVSSELLLVHSSRGETIQAPLGGARSVRVVPLSRGSHHSAASGWQVTLARPEGDVLVGKPLAEWQSAHALARAVCDRTGLPMDPLTERLFSQVGRINL
jgi:hypothetical protein